MAFEFHNPHACRQGCHLGPKFGEVKVEPGQYVPTPAQERAGITAKMFEPHVAKSFLHKTPGNVRRRLRAEHDAELHENQVVRTAEVETKDARGPEATSGVEAASEIGIAVAEDVGESVFVGDEAERAPRAPEAPIAPVAPPVPPTGGPRRPEDKFGGSLQKSANDLQGVADRRCSSTAAKEGRQLR